MDGMQITAKDILAENTRRNSVASAPFNPVTGKGSVGSRFTLAISDFPISVQWLPLSMRHTKLVRMLRKYGSVESYITDCLHLVYSQQTYDTVVRTFTRLRIRHDFPFWAAMYVWIKNKDGGEDVRFRLKRPQRRLTAKIEEMRLAGVPIRIILLKARQWGGSTLIQIYMAWLQLVIKPGLNSLIVGHVMDSANEVRDMYFRLINAYPVELLHRIGDIYDPRESKFVGVGTSPNIKRVPQRNCKIKIGSAERPDSARGGDYSLVHCTEVGLWRKTEGKSPEDIIQSATSGILLQPLTLIIYESTAKGVGNFFHREYLAAKKGQSQFTPFFVPWYEIEKYTLPFTDEAASESFARSLCANRLNPNEFSDREVSGRYLWWLWQKGATLEALHWYCEERKKYHDQARMASEYPSDDIEAFANSGANVFDRYAVERFRPACSQPRFVGDVYADGDEGKDVLTNLRFKEDNAGLLWIWNMPETFTDMRVTQRYLAVVDIGGRGKKADWSVIVVFDRLPMIDGEPPVVVAQWYGHIDMDLLAWKAAQIAAFYDNALLVIESNTLETKDNNHDTEGDQADFILLQVKSVYDNLYARRQSEADIRAGAPRKYGFHTNVATKPVVISTLVKVVREQLYIERDERCLDEFLSYEKQGNSYNAVIGKHDDLLMTRAIGLHVCFYEMDLPQVVSLEPHQNRLRQKPVISEATI